jgi:hypothetical protein
MMTVEERFNHIESILARISEAHLELETAQINQQRAHTNLAESLTAFSDETRERISNLTILVDQLIERDRGRSGDV